MRRDDATSKIADIDERVGSAQRLLAQFGCYKIEPPSGRFEKATEDALAKFEHGARLPVDLTRLTPDLLAKLQGNTGAGVWATPAGRLAAARGGARLCAGAPSPARESPRRVVLSKGRPSAQERSQTP